MTALTSQSKFGALLPHAIILLVLAPVISYSVWISAKERCRGRVHLHVAELDSLVDKYGGGDTCAVTTREEQLNSKLCGRVERFNALTEPLDRAEMAAEAYFFCKLLNDEVGAGFWRATALYLGGDCVKMNEHRNSSSKCRLLTLWNELNPSDLQAVNEQESMYFLQGKLGPPALRNPKMKLDENTQKWITICSGK